MTIWTLSYGMAKAKKKTVGIKAIWNAETDCWHILLVVHDTLITTSTKTKLKNCFQHDMHNNNTCSNFKIYSNLAVLNSLKLRYYIIFLDDIHDICKNFTRHGNLFELRSPGYPDYYPTELDCHCSVTSSRGNKVVLEFVDLVLGMMKGRCYDWLMWQSPDHKGSRMVSCGDMKQNRKTIRSQGSKLELYFHAGKVPPVKKLKGFKVRVLGEFLFFISHT